MGSLTTPMEFCALKVPRRVYISPHMDYVAAVGGKVYAQRERLAGFKMKCYATIKYRTLFLGELMPVGD